MKKILTLLSAVFMLTNAFAQSVNEGDVVDMSDSIGSYQLSIGDVYEANGKKGVVFEVSADGKHGRIISIQEEELDWYGAKGWVVAQLGDGWRLPTKQELRMIWELRNNAQFNNGLSLAGSPEMLWAYCYWSGEEANDEYAWAFFMAMGKNNFFRKDMYNYVRAVSTF